MSTLLSYPRIAEEGVIHALVARPSSPEPRRFGPLFSNLMFWYPISGYWRQAVANILDKPTSCFLFASRSYTGTEFPAELLQGGRHRSGNATEILI